MIVLVDTDVLLDLALDRAPFVEDSAALLENLERGRARGVVAQMAVSSPVADFEDALQVGAALAAGADLIATRNVKDFRRSPVPALRPGQVVARLS